MGLAERRRGDRSVADTNTNESEEEAASEDEETSTATATEHVNGACPRRPQKLKGTAEPGDSCTVAEDCEPACCSCSSDGMSGQWLGAACVNGKCASTSQTCSRTKKPALCSSSSPAPPQTLDQKCGRIGFVGTDARSCEDRYSTTCCAQKKKCADTPECSAYLACRSTCPGDVSGPACLKCRDYYPLGAALLDNMSSCSASCGSSCERAYMP